MFVIYTNTNNVDYLITPSMLSVINNNKREKNCKM